MRRALVDLQGKKIIQSVMGSHNTSIFPRGCTLRFWTFPLIVLQCVWCMAGGSLPAVSQVRATGVSRNNVVENIRTRFN